MKVKGKNVTKFKLRLSRVSAHAPPNTTLSDVTPINSDLHHSPHHADAAAATHLEYEWSGLTPTVASLRRRQRAAASSPLQLGYLTTALGRVPPIQ